MRIRLMMTVILYGMVRSFCCFLECNSIFCNFSFSFSSKYLSIVTSCIIHTDPDSGHAHVHVHIMVSYLQSIKQNNSKYISIPYHTIPYHTIPYHTIPYHTIPYHTYHRTPTVLTELSHQQTREIQQHQDKIHNDHLNTTTANLNLNPFKININIETANAKIRQAANKFAAATKTAADYYSNTNTNTNSHNHGSDRYRNSNRNSYRNINVNGNHANESKIGTIDESHEYTGPYAKASSKHTGRRHNNDLNGACDDFGLRDSYTDTDLNMNMNMNTNMNTYASASIFGEYDPFRSFHNHNHRHHQNSNHDTQNSATSAPLLSNNYGMDVELGNEHAHARANEHGSASTSASSPTQHNTNHNHNHNQHDKKYVFLQTFRVKKERGTVANLDLFFTSLYNYYYHRGVVPIIGKGIVELISLFFTLWLSVFLIAYVDWQRLRSCKDEETCEDFLSGYIYDKVREIARKRERERLRERKKQI